MKILLTNWINIIAVFLGAELCTITLTLADPNYQHNFVNIILGSLFLVVGYGMMFWLLFLISLLILDTVLIIPGRGYLKIKLLVEWFIISSPFIYWVIIYHEWVFAAAVASFLVSQILRLHHISKMAEA